eukprot:gnl/TRDRNA2_/TRDRNA2_207867_c0_seq1.p1 gnl/TRDRNA2_/TRDRNA2_207867_c0~~gnl/TRDRNA2_/TRDRNA2_207867_c0_seq1.p1  ORF type:complete len:260 (+),score=41.06 gnl/TRDRNA2_/TRDRNA2_207867_c0_seq1:67-846(+)
MFAASPSYGWLTKNHKNLLDFGKAAIERAASGAVLTPQHRELAFSYFCMHSGPPFAIGTLTDDHIGVSEGAKFSAREWKHIHSEVYVKTCGLDASGGHNLAGFLTSLVWCLKNDWDADVLDFYDEFKEHFESCHVSGNTVDPLLVFYDLLVSKHPIYIKEKSVLQLVLLMNYSACFLTCDAADHDLRTKLSTRMLANNVHLLGELGAILLEFPRETGNPQDHEWMRCLSEGDGKISSVLCESDRQRLLELPKKVELVAV